MSFIMSKYNFYSSYHSQTYKHDVLNTIEDKYINIQLQRKRAQFIFRHHKLKELAISMYNHANQLPSSFKNLKYLKRFSIWFGSKRTLPQSILELKNLEYVELVYIERLRLDSRFLNFKKIKQLVISPEIYKHNKRFIPKRLKYKKILQMKNGEQLIVLANKKRDLESEYQNFEK